MSAGEKTEKATPKRRQEARERGQVGRSPEINSATVLLAVVIVLVGMGPLWYERLGNLLRDSFALSAAHQVTTQTIGPLMGMFLAQIAVLMAPLLGAVLVAGLAANMIQNRPGFSPKALTPDLKRINPKSGAKRLFGSQGALELVKSLLKVAIVAAAATIVIWPALDTLRLLLFTSPEQVGQTTLGLMRALSYAVIIVLIPFAIGDFILQRIIFERSLRMSKQEVKEETRQQDIAPELRAAIRRRAALLARGRMLDAVPEATVIITNPTHYAVALRYEADWNAPRVVAKGADLIAQRIREIGEEHDVAIVPNPPLARGLYASVDLDQEISPEFFLAVVEVLTFVHRSAQRRFSWT
jgi:flagellar biosynthesis protein FlhB